MTKYDVVVIFITLANFIILILNFVNNRNSTDKKETREENKDKRDLRDSIIELTVEIKNLNEKLSENAVKNKQDHDHFYKITNNHETRITVLEKENTQAPE